MVYRHELSSNVYQDMFVYRHVWVTAFVRFCACRGGEGADVLLVCENIFMSTFANLGRRIFQFKCICLCVCRRGCPLVSMCFRQILLEVKPFGSMHQKMNVMYRGTWPRGADILQGWLQNPFAGRRWHSLVPKTLTRPRIMSGGFLQVLKEKRKT